MGGVIGGAVGVLALAVFGLYLRFLYAPAPPDPPPDASVVDGRIAIDGRERTYMAVIPRDLPASAPLLFVFHGSNQDPRAIREASGYGFDALAVEEGLVVVYPEGYEGNWHDCRTAADYPARTENIVLLILSSGSFPPRFSLSWSPLRNHRLRSVSCDDF